VCKPMRDALGAADEQGSGEHDDQNRRRNGGQ
jgi:hypothetical protein